MMLRLLTTTAVVAVGLLAAPPIFAQTAQPSHPAATSAKDALDQEDKTFVREAAAGGMAEVELSKVAQKSENGDVKRFAERMIEDPRHRFCLGVQWHPEFEISEADRRIFRAFIEASSR